MEMTAPFAFSDTAGLAIAVVVGFFFGLFLERGGLGNPHKLVGVFYLRDFAVPKAMFTAILVASCGLYLLADLGMLDMERIWIVPTFFWPQLVGGALFGVGFVVSGYCPGTAVAGLASGRLDALVSLAGIVIGSFLFAVFYPSLEPFYNTTSMGSVTIPVMLRVSHWFVIAFLAVMATGMFFVMERFEKRKGRGA